MLDLLREENGESLPCRAALQIYDMLIDGFMVKQVDLDSHGPIYQY